MKRIQNAVKKANITQKSLCEKLKSISDQISEENEQLSDLIKKGFDQNLVDIRRYQIDQEIYKLMDICEFLGINVNEICLDIYGD